MASRILGFLLGLFFIVLAAAPFFVSMLPAQIGNIITTTYTTVMLGPISAISLLLFLLGVFCLQSAIRDTWPFYG